MGERGATTAIQILRDEVDTTLALLGVASLQDLSRAALLDTLQGPSSLTDSVRRHLPCIYTPGVRVGEESDAKTGSEAYHA
jgi:hypothetical protein